jgi:hypothetical protein
MKVIDYKILSKYIKCSTNQNFDYRKIIESKDFEKNVKEHLNMGYTLVGGVTITFDSSVHFILSQTLVKYESEQ